MEPRLRTKICDNFYTLTTSTTCSPEFLQHFKNKKVFTLDDIDAIKAEDKDPSDQAYQFYRRILDSKVNTSGLFLTALQETKQHVPFDLLTKDCDNLGQMVVVVPKDLQDLFHLAKTGKKFQMPPLPVVQLLLSKTFNILLLHCVDMGTTMSWIKDTTRNITRLAASTLDLSVMVGHADTLYVLEMYVSADLSEIIKKLTLKSGKFIVLYDREGEQYESEIAQGSGTFGGKDELQWDMLSEDYKCKLVKRIKVNSGLAIEESSIPSRLGGLALLTLILAEETDDRGNTSLFGCIMHKYLDSILSDVKEKPTMEELSKHAITKMYPITSAVLFPKSTYSNEDTAEVKEMKKRVFSLLDQNLNYFFLGRYLPRTFRQLDHQQFCQKVLALIDAIVLIQHRPIVTYKFKDPLAAYFVDYFLTIHQTDPSDWAWANLTLLLHASIMGSHVNIVRAIIRSVPLTSDILLVAVLKSNIITVNEVLSAYRDAGGLIKRAAYLNNHSTIFHVALMRGEENIVNLLWYQYGFMSRLKKVYMRNVIHSVVGNTVGLSDEQVAERIGIMKTILEHDKSLLETMEDNDYLYTSTPLLSPKVHLKLIKFMMQQGADAKSLTDGSFDSHRTLAHVAADRKPEEYHELLTHLMLHGHGDLLRASDSRGVTPLHDALFNMDVLEETIRLFVRLQVDLNAVDIDGSNVLRYAVAGDRKEDVLHTLVQLGANWKVVDLSGNSMVHKSAYHGNPHATRYFIALGVDVNMINNAGDNALHVALKGTLWMGEENINDIVATLLQAGIKPDLENKAGRTPLRYVERGPFKKILDPKLVEILRGGASKAE